MPMIGKLRQRVALQARTQAPTGSEAIADSYATVATVWAEVEQLEGAVFVAGQQTEERATHKVTIRNRTDLEAWRYLLWGTKRMKVIETRAADDRRRFLDILAEELT
jgi:SPP1 family predicted phage head-tail adaptor